MFGAFLVGVAIGDSPRLRERTRAILSEFIAFLLAPLFFASIGLQVDFGAHFHAPTVIAVLAVACAGKLLGCAGGARLAGLPARESWAIAAAMNMRGAMEIVLGVLALQAGIIEERLFVALVTMAIVTSVAGGPAIQRILHRRKPRTLLQHLQPAAFVPALPGGTQRDAIRALVRALAAPSGLDAAAVEAAVLEREALAPTGLSLGIAVPHARIDGLDRPTVAIGLSGEGVDFNSMDGLPARVVVLLLTSRSFPHTAASGSDCSG
jgi:mannitol/fructose-specific phosphotransferase system IIA component (Ntr-type)